MGKAANPVKLGLLGKSLPYTLSPFIHKKFMDNLNINGVYDKYEMDERQAARVIDFMKDNHISGMNVTIPYKETACALVDESNREARAIGAVNTILIKDGVSYGFNTDCAGAAAMFKKARVSLSGKNIVILGSGGASRALIYAFHIEGAAKITVAARNLGAMRRLKEKFPYIGTCPSDRIPEGDILVNATPVGMFPDTGVSPVGIDVLRGFHTAADLVYNPPLTEFLRIAKSEGLYVVTGLRMLTEQAAASEEIWFGRKTDPSVAEKVYRELSARFSHTL